MKLCVGKFDRHVLAISIAISMGYLAATEELTTSITTRRLEFKNTQDYYATLSLSLDTFSFLILQK